MRPFLLAALISCVAVGVSVGAERTWNGGGGLGTSEWSMAINWASGAPTADDALTFPSATYKTAVNDFTAGTAFGPLTINAGGYVLSGNLINLQGGTFLNGANTSQVALPLSLSALTAFTVSNVNGVLNLNQPISGTGGIIKAGNGLLVINGNHSYSGGTLISAGGLQVGGNLPGMIQISTGDLVGLGSVDGITALNLGMARIAPGTSSATGTLTCDGDVRLYATDGLLFDITSTGADKLAVNGAINLGQAGINPTIQSSFTPAVGTTWVLIENDGTDPITTGYSPSSYLIPTFTRNSQRFQISFVGGTNRNDVVLQKVGPQNTSVTTFTTSDSSIAYGDPVTFTVMLTGVVNGAQVSFWDGNEYIGSATVVGAQAQLVGVTTLKPGARSITALFEGNTTYAPVQTGILTQTVTGGVTPTVGLAVSPSGTSNPDQLVTLTATVGGTSPTGTVTFYDGTVAIGAPVTVSSNQAVTSTTALIAGAHSLSAAFTGTGVFQNNTSSAIPHTVVGVDTSIVVSSSASSAVAGEEVTFTAAVTGGANTGFVTFRDGTITLATVALAGDGTAAMTTGGLPAGTHAITALYLGTTTFEPSSSSILSQTITAHPDGSGGGGGPVELEESSGCGMGGGVATFALALLMLVGLRLRRS